MTASAISISSTKYRALVLLVAVASATASTGFVFGHGASKGLHLHLIPAAALPGGKVTVQVDSLIAIDQVVIGLADAPPITKRLKTPAQHVEVELTVPRHLKQGTTISVQAEARGAAQPKPLRASSLLLVGDPKQPIVLP
ncbi:MAG: hypothetical protein U0V87_04410 [Acidobacteriota bacterium]